MLPGAGNAIEIGIIIRLMDKKYHRKKLGAWGEEVAEKFLKEKGYMVLTRNLRIGRGELDILAFKDEYLMVVEVKTKTSRFFGEPAEEVDEKKIEQICNLVEKLIGDTGLLEKIGLKEVVNWQLDIVAVYGDGRRIFDIIHYENVGIWG